MYPGANMYISPEKAKLVENMQAKVGNEFHVIYRCHHCYFTYRINFKITGIEQQGMSYYHTWEVINLPVGFKNDSKRTFPAKFAVCPKCEYGTSWKEVQGTVKENIECNDVCTHALGHVCKCSCGGHNHGSIYDVKGE